MNLDTTEYENGTGERVLEQLERLLAGHDAGTLACLLAAISHVTGAALVELVGFDAIQRAIQRGPQNRNRMVGVQLTEEQRWRQSTAEHLDAVCPDCRYHECAVTCPQHHEYVSPEPKYGGAARLNERVSVAKEIAVPKGWQSDTHSGYEKYVVPGEMGLRPFVLRAVGSVVIAQVHARPTAVLAQLDYPEPRSEHARIEWCERELNRLLDEREGKC